MECSVSWGVRTWWGKGAVVNCSRSSSSYTQHVTASDGREPVVHEGTDHAFIFPTTNERKGVNP